MLLANDLPFPEKYYIIHSSIIPSLESALRLISRRMSCTNKSNNSSFSKCACIDSKSFDYSQNYAIACQGHLVSSHFNSWVSNVICIIIILLKFTALDAEMKSMLVKNETCLRAIAQNLEGGMVCYLILYSLFFL